MSLFDDLADNDWEDDELDAELADSASVSCPYCGERVEIMVDAAGGDLQEYVEDCEVCCRPWSVRVSLSVDGIPSVSVTPLDDF